MLINATSQKIIINQLMPKMDAFLIHNFPGVIPKIRLVKPGRPYAQQTGLSVPLKQIADVGILWQPAEIIRRNRLKIVILQADVDFEIWIYDHFGNHFTGWFSG